VVYLQCFDTIGWVIRNIVSTWDTSPSAGQVSLSAVGTWLKRDHAAAARTSGTEADHGHSGADPWQEQRQG